MLIVFVARSIGYLSTMSGRKKKPAEVKMSERVPFVCTRSQRVAYDRAATDAKLDRSEWIRQVLDAEVRRKSKSNRGA